jgi:hypothetical protein
MTQQVKQTQLNIPDTSVNRDKIAYTVAHHIVNECMTNDQVRNLAIQNLEDGFNETNYSILDLVDQVKTTKIKENNADFYPEQALHFGNSGFSDGALYFFVSDKDRQSNIVKEEQL